MARPKSSLNKKPKSKTRKSSKAPTRGRKAGFKHSDATKKKIAKAMEKFWSSVKKPSKKSKPKKRK